MRPRILLSAFFLLPSALFSIPAAQSPSLADVARKEAKRRRELEQQGIREDVITNDAVSQRAKRGNLSVFSPGPAKSGSPRPSVDSKRSTPAPFLKALQKLDREIRQLEDRLALLRERESKERWTLPVVERSRRSARAAPSKDCRSQMQELEMKLKRLRQERGEVYDQGRKAGFLPGELVVKGIVP